MQQPEMPPVPIGVARSTPPPGIVGVYAVNIGSSGASELAYHVARGAEIASDVLSKVERLGDLGRKKPYLWP